MEEPNMSTLLVFTIGLRLTFCQAQINLWSNKEPAVGKIDYAYDRLLENSHESTDECIKSVVEQSIKEIQNDVDCVSFDKKDYGKLDRNNPYLIFQYSNNLECQYPENIGMPSSDSLKRVEIQLNENCVNKKILKYYLSRILGLQDEHSRPDRDQFVVTHEDNIDDEFKKKYKISHKVEEGYIGVVPVNFDYKNYPYDFSSITHFGPFENAKDPSKPTISAVQTYAGVTFGEREHLSVVDIRKLRDLYSPCNCCNGKNKDQSDDGNVTGIVKPIQCSFDLPLCAMVVDWTNPGPSWYKTSGPVSDKGPQTDHSNGNGTYMFTNETSYREPARMVSITEVSPREVCASLYYYLLGNSTLRVMQQESVSGNTTVIAEKENNNDNGPSWMLLQVDHKASNMWRLVIEADVTYGGVAIDDVSVEHKKCDTLKKCVHV